MGYDAGMTVKQFFGIVELRTKIISMATFSMGTLYAYYLQGTFDPLIFSLMLIAVLLVDMGTTGFNAYFDFRSGIDTAERNREKNKVILHQGIDARKALTVSLVLFGLAAVTGILIAWLTSWYIILVGGACMAVGFAYTGGPYPISRTPLGEIAAGGFLGTVLFAISYYVQAGTIGWEALLVSLSSSAVVASILTANNTCDIENDAAAGRRTLSILVGRKISTWILYLLGFGAYGWAGIMILIGYLPLIAIPFYGIGLGLTIGIYRSMHTIGYGYTTKDPIMGSIAKVYLIYALMTLAGLGLNSIIESL